MIPGTGTIELAVSKLEFDKVRERVARYAVSEPGRQELLSLSISFSVSDITTALSRVTEVKRVLEEEDSLPLEGVQPVGKSVARAAVAGAMLLPRELHDVRTTLAAARSLRTFAAKRKETAPLLWELAAALYIDKVLEYNIDQAIDDSGAVRATASRELQSIRRSIAERYDQLRSRLQHILRAVTDFGFTQDEIITTREGRMVIPVKVEHKNRVPGFIHSASASGATVFIEPTETLDLNNEIRSLQFQEQREVDRILRDLTAEVGKATPFILESLDTIACIDALQAKARYSIEVLGVAPEVSTNGSLRLVQARHPLLLLHHGLNGTVPLDLTLGEHYETLVISGPNAGGKTVAMKCVGLLCLMTQAGLHIPAGDGSRVRVFRRFFVEIGDEQSIESDLSTFSSHLKNLRELGDEASEDSLVLIDEIGSGTDPAEGGAIAAAVLERLARRHAMTIATTHQGSLKVFAHETEGMENGAMEYDQATLTPTYRFRAGVPGSSYALEMASRLGFSESLLSRSRELMGSRQTKLESLLAELEGTVQHYRSRLQTVEQEKARLDALTETYETKVSSLSREIRELRKKAVDEAQGIVEKANAVIERSIREIREGAAGREAIRVARTEVAQLKQQLETEALSLGSDGTVPEPAEICVGGKVRLRAGTDEGEVTSISDDRKTAVVVFGSIKMKVAASDLVRSRAPSAPHEMTPVQASIEITAQRELDLRGMTGDEALPLVDKFIDMAILAGLHRIDIIHGKGTGALRRKVTEFLSGHPRVRSHRLGEWNEGGTGATVVELSDE